MIIEITGTGTGNKGAELMLVAILQFLKSTYPEVKIAVDPSFGSYLDRAKYGLYLNLDFFKWNRTQLALTLIPDHLQQKLGIIYKKKIDILIDAAGFAFGDQLPVKRAIEFAKKLEKVRKDGTKIIMLPQALGPFQKEDTKLAFSKIVQYADLLYARDPKSLEFALKATGNNPKIKLAPDFTNLVTPTLNKPSENSNDICIIPNDRMIEKAANTATADAYLQFIKSAIQEVHSHNYNPILLVHSKPDKKIAEKIISTTNEMNITVVNEQDPVEIKRIIGESRLVIASRFHALVSALSQGVPAIGTSWSHKYQMLFEDYNCSRMLIDDRFNIDVIKNYFSSGLNEEELRANLKLKAEKFKGQAKEMWEEIEFIINHGE